MKFKLPGVDVFQTVYFTSQRHGLYRASITGDTLICEWAGDESNEFDRLLAAQQVAAAAEESSGSMQEVSATAQQLQLAANRVQGMTQEFRTEEFRAVKLAS